MKYIYLFIILFFYANTYAQINKTYSLGANKNITVNKMITTSDGGYLLVGSNNAANSTVITPYLKDDGVIIKLNATGVVTWTKNLANTAGTGGTADINRIERIKDVVQLPDGGYLICGDADQDPLNGKLQGFIIRLDANGNILNQKLFVNTQASTISGVNSQCGFLKILTLPTGISTTDVIISGSLYPSFSTDAFTYKNEGFFMRINFTTLNVVWTKVYTSSNRYWFTNSGSTIYNGQLYFSGTNCDMLKDGNNGFYIKGLKDLIKLDYNGNVLAAKTFSQGMADGDMVMFNNNIVVANHWFENYEVILFSVDKYLNLINNNNVVKPTKINMAGGTENIKMLVDNNRLKIFTNTYSTPILFDYFNGTFAANAFKSGSNGNTLKHIKLGDNYYSSAGNILKKGNNFLLAFNSTAYGPASTNFNNIFLGEFDPTKLSTCNYDRFQFATQPITVLQEDLQLTPQNFTNFNVVTNYFQSTTLPAITTTDASCAPCTSPELLLVPIRNIPYDFENIFFSQTTSQFLSSIKASLGTDWSVAASYASNNVNNVFGYYNQYTDITNNTNGNWMWGYNYNISNQTYNNNVWMINFSKNWSPLNTAPKSTICNFKNININETGNYLFGFDFGNIQFLILSGIIAFDIKLINSIGTTIVTKSYNYNWDGININYNWDGLNQNSATSGNFPTGSNATMLAPIITGFKDYNVVFNNIPIGVYGIELILTYNDGYTNHYAFDNFSLKKMCGTCQSYPGRPSSRMAKEEEEPITKLANQNELMVYPNPSNSIVNLKFALKEDENSNLYIVDYTGREVQSIVKNEVITAGEHQYQTDISNLSAGMYIAILETNGKRTMQKFVVQH